MLQWYHVLFQVPKKLFLVFDTHKKVFNIFFFNLLQIQSCFFHKDAVKGEILFFGAILFYAKYEV